MREVSVDTAAQMIEDGAFALDVREREEFAGGHVPGAVNIPMGQLSGRLDEVDRDRPVVVICRSGNRSGVMTDVLTAAGFEAANMLGGTLEWVDSGKPVEHPQTSALTVRVIETPSLGDRSYLVHDGRVALVVDPQRDIDRVLEVLETDGVRLTHIFETHIHNDYVTGGFALAQATGAAYHVNAVDEVSFQRTPVRDGDVVRVGDRMAVRVIATPGHTFTHLSYALAERTAAGERAVGVFTGGSLLYGATGRPDLLGPDHTDALVRHQHASARKLADALPDEAEVFPTHGFGSFCSASQSDATSSTIGHEKHSNPVLTQDEETYVRELLEGLAAYPAYYGRRPALAHRVRGRARAGLAQLRPGRRVLDVPGLAHRVGHPGDPARRDCRPGRGGPARAGPHRHRPPGGARHRGSRGLERPAAALLRDRDVRRPGRRAPPPRGGRARRAAHRRAREGVDRGCGQHPDPRDPQAGRRGAGG